MKKSILNFAGLLGVLLVAGILPAQQASPPSKVPPQAKTQQEYADYTSAYALSGGATAEKAASDFAAKHPQSELRAYLYAKAIHDYQNENNPGKMLSMGENVLGLDPDNSIALVLTATVLADSLSDGDHDREQKIAEVKKNSNRALQTLDSSFIPPPGATAEQVAAYKSTLQSMAYSALGIMELKTGDAPGAERDLRSAVDRNKTQPDPYIWYHLALAQDKQNKYPEALASITQALQNMGSNADLAKLANGERERLLQLTGGTPPSGQKPPP